MIFNRLTIQSGWFIAVLLVAGCSSNIPPEIKQPLEGSPGIAEVREKTDAYVNQKVRWGGVILQIENKENTSKLTIVALPLDDNGEPLESDKSPGRFIATIDAFLEPQVYSPNREITVTGHLRNTEILKVGEFDYEYPVVAVENYYLWPVKPERGYVDYPPYWLYDPYYYPWPYPYYPHHNRH